MDYTAKLTHTGSRIFDLSLSPEILIYVQNPSLKQNIFSSNGTAHFSLPNTANFGGKLLYQNEFFSDPRNTIYLNSP